MTHKLETHSTYLPANGFVLGAAVCDAGADCGGAAGAAASCLTSGFDS